METKIKNTEKYLPYLILIAAAAAVYSIIYYYAGDFHILSQNFYNTFSRQAEAWLSGRLFLAENIPWLELAVFEGNYYVSFTPFPSILMLPFVYFMGINTPDHMIALFVSFISLIYAYKLALNLLENRKYAVLLSLFLILGSNYLHTSMWGAVWYITQNLAFLFTMMAFYYSLTDKKAHSIFSLLFLCAAIGCRPLNGIYLPVILFLIYKREDTNISGFIKRTLIYCIPAMILGAFYMGLNYFRFGSVLEFGHSYLPEFVNDPLGQFHPSRIFFNLYRMLFHFDVTENPMFFGFAFWVASPIIISYFIYLGIYIYLYKSGRNSLMIQKDKDMFVIFSLFILCLIHLFIFSFHRSLGGHQFGSRYSVDTLVAFYTGMLFVLKNIRPSNYIYLNIIPMIFGISLNIYGTVVFLKYYF